MNKLNWIPNSVYFLSIFLPKMTLNLEISRLKCYTRFVFDELKRK